MTHIVPKRLLQPCAQQDADTPMSHPPASSEDELTGLSPRNNSLGAAGGWAALSPRRHQRQRSLTRVPKPICAPKPAPNPSGTWWVHHSIPGTARGCQGSVKSPGAASQLVPPHLLLLGLLGSQQGGLGSGSPLGVMQQLWEQQQCRGGGMFGTVGLD